MTRKELQLGTTAVSMVADPPPASGKLVLERKIPSDDALITPLVLRVTDQLLMDKVIKAEDRNRVGLCIEEALRNAVIHGNKRDFKKQVSLKVFVNEKDWSIQVDDDGDGFDIKQVADPYHEDSVWREGGRGIGLMSHYMHRVAYFRSGRTVVLTRTL